MNPNVVNSDTICAISTPAGVGGIAVARVSGPRAIDVVSSIWRGKDLSAVPSHTAHLGSILSAPSWSGDIPVAEDSPKYTSTLPHFHTSPPKVEPLDQGVVTVFRAPASYTGDDVVEISVHGSPYVQRQLIHALIAAGARMAEPGEFTRRAFAAGKLDLAQAEAVADIIASDSRAAHRIAMQQMRGQFSSRLRMLRDQLIDLASLLELELDFSEEDVEFASRIRLLDLACDIKAEVDRLAASFAAGQAIKDGIPVAIVGPTNAGKSSLLNALIGDDRAIVSDIHGTTRDIIEDTLRIGDYAFRIMDTAGLRTTTDTIEGMGIERSHQAAAKASIVLYITDLSSPQPITVPATDAAVILVGNKADIAPGASLPEICGTATSADVQQSAAPQGAATVIISARTGEGIDALKEEMLRVAKTADAAATGEGVLVANARHYQALVDSSESISRAIDALRANLSGDLIALDVRLTIHHLSAILGDITTTDLLSTIFSRFCIGK